MATKRGIAITGIILAAVTGASFLMWIIPEDLPATFVVTDHEDYLDGIVNIHEVLTESTEIEYKGLLSGEISPQEYVRGTEITSDQVTGQISEFVTSKPTKEWEESYINYMEALKSFNSYITETRVLAGMIEDGNADWETADILAKIDALKSRSDEFVKRSEETRPR